MSHALVAWLILVAGVLTLLGGVALRSFVGRRRGDTAMRRFVRRLRRTAVARVLFGPVRGDALDDEELDSMILMPSVVLACGLCLTAFFLLGYDFVV